MQEQKSIAIGGQHPWGRGEGRGGAWRDYNLMLEPKLEEALISANQEPHAAEVRARNLAIIAIATTTSSDDQKEASDSEKGSYTLASGRYSPVCT